MSLNGYAYAVSLDGCGETHSNEGWGDNVTMIDLPESVSAEDAAEHELGADDIEFLTGQAAALVFQSNDGFIDVEWFESKDAAQERFDEVEPDYYPADEDGDEDEG